MYNTNRPNRKKRPVGSGPVKVKLSKTDQRKPKRRKNIVIAGVTALAIMVMLGVGIYLFGINPNQRSILTVGKENVRTDYFIKRVANNSSGTITSKIQDLVGELIISNKPLP